MHLQIFLLTSCFVIKFALDFISPSRELNFILFNFILINLLLIKIFKISPFFKKEFLSILVFVIICTTAFILSGIPKIFAQFTSAVLIYLVVKSYVEGFKLNDYVLVSRISFYAFMIFAVLNFITSFFTAAPLNREFYNFEHANLLGSYLLISLPFIYVMQLANENILGKKLLLSVVTLLSTSTGSFVTSLIQYIPFKKKSAHEYLFFFFSIFILLFITVTLLPVIYPDFANKLLGPVRLIANGSFNELYQYAQDRVRIQALGEEYNSSMVWRLYAYVIFIDYILHQNTLQLLLGNGFQGSHKVWEGIAAHNDFITILIDFGLIVFTLIAFVFYRLFRWAFSENRLILPVILILFFRLLVENNIYSYYLFSSLVMVSSFLFFMHQEVK